MNKIGEKFALNQSETAALFGVSIGTFRKMRMEIGFPNPVFLNKRPLWLTDDLRTWAKSRMSGKRDVEAA